MDSITIRQISLDDPDYYKVYDLREEILRKPIGLSLKDEDLSGDALDTILIAEKGDDVIGCIMIHPADKKSILKLRQMAVANNWQRKGIGNMLVQAAENVCWQNGAEQIILHARITAQSFYERSGYTVTSEVFTEVGIPHVVMEKHKP